MRLRRVSAVAGCQVQVSAGKAWCPLRDVLARLSPEPDNLDLERWSGDVVAFLEAPVAIHQAVGDLVLDKVPNAAEDSCVLPFEPRSFRDFMLYERHAIDAARGFVRSFKSHLLPIVSGFESITGKEFPALKPKALWHREPIYYFGNHLNFLNDGDDVPMPSYTKALDYELELGFVLARGLYNASSDQAEAAIGGFFVLNDFSARDVQLDEMRSGFGPQKSKHFANAMSSIVVTADEILPRWASLEGYVRINDDEVAKPLAAGARWSLGEVLAHASRSERLHPGEVFGSGTLPGGSGIELDRFLQPGDVIEVGIHGLGSIANRIVEEVSS